MFNTPTAVEYQEESQAARDELRNATHPLTKAFWLLAVKRREELIAALVEVEEGDRRD